MTGGEWLVAGGAFVSFLVTNGINVWGTWEQRRQRIELQESNRIARVEREEQQLMDESVISTQNVRLEQWASWRFYLPIVISGTFMLLTWVAIGVNNYYRNPPETATQPTTSVSAIPSSPTRITPQAIPSALTSPSPSIQVSSEPRTFTDATPAYLMRIYNEHTDVQAARLVQSYIGKWMKVEGIIEQVSSEPIGGGALVILRYYKKTSESPLLLELRFKSDWLERVSSLTKGDQIFAVGRSQRADQDSVVLDDCEFQF